MGNMINSCNDNKKQGCTNKIRSNKITASYFILTENCNLRCSYCFEGKTRDITKYMSKETAFKGIDFLFDQQKSIDEKDREVIDITFFGGEPMLCPDLMIEMLHYGYKKSRETGIKVSFSIITNGTIWNEGVERFLDTWITYTKDISIQLSYDGIPEIQDMNRICACKGIKSSEIIEDAVKHYIDYYNKHEISLRKLHIHCCLTEKSIPHIADSYKYFRETLGIINSQFAWVMNSPWTEDSFVEFDKQLDMLAYYLVVHGIKEFPFKHFDQISGCGSGRKLVAIDCDGNIYPCHRFFFYKLENREKFIYGNIYDETPISNTALRDQFVNFELKKIDNCGPCQVCLAENYDRTGSIYKILHPDEEAKFMAIINYHFREFEEFKIYLEDRVKLKEAYRLLSELEAYEESIADKTEDGGSDNATEDVKEEIPT